MQKWEYLFVTCRRARGGWRPRRVNGQKLQHWRQGPNTYEAWGRGPTMHEFCNQLGQEGWELVNMTTPVPGDLLLHYRLVFKRPVP
jgi:hypothetical protein